jgi:hypothetical protein
MPEQLSGLVRFAAGDETVPGVTVSVGRTAYPRFRRVVSGRELAEVFTPSDGEAAAKVSTKSAMS